MSFEIRYAGQDFNTALAGMTEGILIVPENVVSEASAATSALVVPEAVVLKVEYGGRLRLKQGAKLRIEGRIAAGSWQIFDGSGLAGLDAKRARVGAFLPEWWGCLPTPPQSSQVVDCLQPLKDCLSSIGTNSRVQFGRGSYYFLGADSAKDSVVISGFGVHLQGMGKDVTRILWAPKVPPLPDHMVTDIVEPSPLACFRFQSANHCSLRDMSFGQESSSWRRATTAIEVIDSDDLLLDQINVGHYHGGQVLSWGDGADSRILAYADRDGDGIKDWFSFSVPPRDFRHTIGSRAFIGKSLRVDGPNRDRLWYAIDGLHRDRLWLQPSEGQDPERLPDDANWFIHCNESIGLLLRGRQNIRVRDFICQADRPVVVAANPLTPTIDADHVHFRDVVLTASNHVIDRDTFFMDADRVSNFVLDGFNSLNGGRHGFHWQVEKSAAGGLSEARLCGIRKESADPTKVFEGWAVRIDCDPTKRNRHVAIEGCIGSDAGHGIFARGVDYLTLRGCGHFVRGKQTINVAASAVKNVLLENCRVWPKTEVVGLEKENELPEDEDLRTAWPNEGKCLPECPIKPSGLWKAV